MTEGVLLYGTALAPVPERIFRFYGSLFQVEFAFRDAKQYLDFNDCQTRSQVRLHIHQHCVCNTQTLCGLSAARRHAARSNAGRCIPQERPWLRALPLEPMPAGS